jgi:hypothetical protein
MLLLIDIFSINKGRGYENPSLDIIVTEHCSTRGFPLEEAREHCFLNQSFIFVVILISFMCYCGDYAGYITVILPFLAFYLCSAYFLYLVYYTCIKYFAKKHVKTSKKLPITDLFVGNKKDTKKHIVAKSSKHTQTKKIVEQFGDPEETPKGWSKQFWIFWDNKMAYEESHIGGRGPRGGE